MKRLHLAIDLVEDSISEVEEDPDLSAIEVAAAIRFSGEFSELVPDLRAVESNGKNAQLRESSEQKERLIWIYWIFDHDLPSRFVVQAMIWSWKDSIFLPIIGDWKISRVAAPGRVKQRVDQFFNDLFDAMALDPAHPIRIK